MKLLRNVVLALITLALVGAGLVWIAQQAMLAKFVTPTLEELNAVAARNVDDWLDDTRALNAHPMFKLPRPDKDASAYLNKLVPWTGDDDLGDWEKGAAALALPENVDDLLQGYPADVQDEGALTAAASNLDYTWMKSLDDYGYWELTRESPWSESRDVTAALAPIPQYSVLLKWSKLRLWQARQTDDLENAVHEVRQLGWLALSTETLVGAMISIAFFDIAESAARRFGPPGAIAPLLSWDDRNLLRRTVWAGPGLVAAPIAPATVKKALGAEGVAVCVALNEMAIVESLLWPQSLSTFEERTPFIVGALESPPAGCRIAAARELYASDGKSDRTLVETLTRSGDVSKIEPEDLKQLSWAGWLVPGAEDSIIKLLNSIAVPGFVSRYEDERKSPPEMPADY